MSSVSERLAEIEARVEVATEGPWVAHCVEGWHMRDRAGNEIDDPWFVSGPEVYGDMESGGMTEATAKLIAHARSDIPWLLEQVREARKVVEAAVRLRDEPQRADEPADQGWVDLLEALEKVAPLDVALADSGEAGGDG